MIKISLPNPNDYQGDIKMFLRQCELSIHHATKAWEEIEKDALEHPDKYEENWREDYWSIFRFPEMDLNERESDKDGNVKVHADEVNEGMQNILLEISI